MRHYEHVIPVELSHAWIHVTILWSTWVALARCSYGGISALRALWPCLYPSTLGQPTGSLAVLNHSADSIPTVCTQSDILGNSLSFLVGVEQPTERSLGLAILNGSSAALWLTDFLRGHIPHLKVGCVDSEQLTFLRRTCNCVLFLHLLTSDDHTPGSIEISMIIIYPCLANFMLTVSRGQTDSEATDVTTGTG